MGRQVGVLGRSALAAAAIILVAGLVVAFIGMGPQRQTAATLASPLAPGVPTGAWPTTTTKGDAGPVAPSPVTTLSPRPEDTPITGGAILDLAPSTSYWSLVRKKDVIAVGEIKEVGAARWNTADGKRPVGFWSLSVEQRRRYFIYKPVVLRVHRFIRTPDPRVESLIFGEPGGQVGQDSWGFRGDPQTPFTAGEKVLVFLAKISLNALPEYPADANPSLLNSGGKHTITDGRARYREIDLPLDEVVRRVEEALRQQ